MNKQTNQARTCTDCMHCLACHLWSNGAISNSVAPKCPQFKAARYASLAELQDLYRMYKGELVPVVHGQWIRIDDTYAKWKCSECGAIEDHSGWPYCHCGAKMDAEEKSGK